MTIDPLEYIKDVSRLELAAGDILIFRTKMMLDKDQVKTISERINNIIGDRLKELDVKLLILTGDFDIAVLRKEALK